MASDEELARQVDAGELSPADLVETILDEAYPDGDHFYLARRIVAALQY